MADNKKVDFKKKVVDFINTEFADLESLKNAEALLKTFCDKKTELEHQLGKVESERPSQMKQTLMDAQALVERAETLKKRSECVCEENESLNLTSESAKDQISTSVQKLRDIKRVSDYIQIIGRIEGYSSDIQSALLIGANEKGVDEFTNMVSFVEELQSSSCTNLLQFASDTMKYWFHLLKGKFGSDFEEILEAHNWPFIKSVEKKKTLPNEAELKLRLPKVFDVMLKIHLPPDLQLAYTNTADQFPSTLPRETILPILLPIGLMLRPLRKRFLYHFHGAKQTNNVDKPEWFFTQILTWINDHQEFLKTKIQPLLESTPYASVNVIREFSRGLVLLAVDKIQTDMNQFMASEGRFCHLVDESLKFYKDLNLRLGRSAMSKLPNCLDVLAQDEPFEVWLNVEQKRALDLLDSIISSPSAWNYQITDSEHDPNKVPECSDGFLTILTCITDRYKTLSCFESRLHFLTLQLELLEDYRLRIVQVRNEQATPVDACYCAVLNSVYFIVQVLNDWTDQPFFMELQLKKNKVDIADLRKLSASKSSQDASPSADSDAKTTDVVPSSHSSKHRLNLGESVFQPVIDLYEHLYMEMISSMVSYVTDDVTARSKPYRNDRWLALPSQLEFVTLSLSASACEMLTVLRERLLQAKSHLSRALFNLLWQNVAAKLNTFLYEELISVNHFNEGGASQLYFDMFKNLFPMFGAYTNKPENYFKDVKEALLILNLSAGSGILLKEVLKQALHSPSPSHPATDPVAALHDIGVFKLSLEQAEFVLSLRVDWKL